MEQVANEGGGTSKPPPQLGSYRLLQQLGSGGMSSVFRGVHVDNGKAFAVKVLPRNFAKNQTLLQRFMREARNAESLHHPNIVSIYDRGLDQGRYYLVLEYVEGGDLNEIVRRDGPMGVEQVVRVAQDVASALRYASNRRMIHRDVKPANILAAPDGTYKVIDLGLALQEEDQPVTRDGTTVGTVDFMSPEQARNSRATSIQSDMYSLGCTMYFLLTGQPPYGGGSIPDKLGRHFSAPIPDPKATRAELPIELSLIVRRLMAKRAKDRYDDYGELLDALDRVRLTSSKPADPPSAELVPLDPASAKLLDALADVTRADAYRPRPPETSPKRRRAEVDRIPEISLLELAELERDSPVAVARGGDSGSGFPQRSEFIDSGQVAIPPQTISRTTSANYGSDAGEWPLQTIIVVSAFVGLVLSLLGVALFTFDSGETRTETPPGATSDDR